MILTVLTDPNEELRKKSKKIPAVEFGSKELDDLIVNLIETMNEENGIGIAAPQVGIHKRVIIVDDGKEVHAYINPRILSKSLRKIDSDEGCLSVPGIWGIVKRSKNVKVKAWNQHGKEVTIKAEGLVGTIFQHEIDHLNGVLFIDKVIRYTKHPLM